MEHINTIILLGAIQGIILSIFLFFSKSHPGTKFLGGLLFVLAYNGFETYSWSSGVDITFFSLFPFVVIFGAGPCLFFYTKSLLEPDSVSNPKLITLHFLPLMVLAIFRTAMFAFHWYALSSDPSLTSTLFEIEMWFVSISEPLSFVSFLIYLTMSWRYARKFRQDPGFSSSENHATRWSHQLLLCMWGVAVAWMFTILIPRILNLDDPLDMHYYPIELSLVILVYWITFAGHHRTKIVHVKNAKPQNPIDIDTAIRCEELLRNAMVVDKLYFDPELSVAKVSMHIKIPQKTISAALNQHLGQSFNDFINGYRVAEVKQRLILHHDEHLTIAGIALDCGFNSQATFQRAFKNITKVSPKEFIARQENQISTSK